MRLRSIVSRETVSLTRIFIVASPDHFGVVLLHADGVVEVHTLILLRVLQAVRTVVDHVLGSCQRFLVVALSLVGRDTYLSASGADRSLHLVVVLRDRSGIDSGTSLQHLRSPLVGTGCIGLHSRRQLASDLLALGDDVVVHLSLRSTRFLQSAQIHTSLIVEDLVTNDRHTAQATANVEVVPGTQETGFTLQRSLFSLTQDSCLTHTLQELVDVSNQRIVIDAPAIIFEGGTMVRTSITIRSLVQNRKLTIVSCTLSPRYTTIVVGQYRFDHHSIAEDLVVGHDTVGLLIEEIATSRHRHHASSQRCYYIILLHDCLKFKIDTHIDHTRSRITQTVGFVRLRIDTRRVREGQEVRTGYIETNIGDVSLLHQELRQCITEFQVTQLDVANVLLPERTVPIVTMRAVTDQQHRVLARNQLAVGIPNVSQVPSIFHVVLRVVTAIVERITLFPFLEP